MKKHFIIFVMFLSIFSFGFKNNKPNNYYQVYLNKELIGTVKSKDKLENYIDKNGEVYKKKYKVDKIYSPKGLVIRKIATYDNKVDSVSNIYKKINKKAKFTVSGYEFKIKKNQDNKITTNSIYVLDKKVFKDSITAIIDTFVGDDRYKAYIDDNQVKITSTGENIQNVYVDEDITVKKTFIPVDSNIYTKTADLTRFLLYGQNKNQSIYEVKAGDTIDNVAFNNKISVDEVLISNNDLTGKNNLLYPGQKLTIAQINPQISIVEESFVVKDIESQYRTEEKYDDNIVMGEEVIQQEGVNGLDRVSQKVKKVNGVIVYVDPKDKLVLKDPINKIVVKGNKYIPDVGSLTNWGWPTDSGWTLSSGYGYRSMWGSHELHTGLDIAGTGYGSKIYATNNGRVVTAESHYSYGNHVVINHNNGYLTLYGHMSKIAVKKGQVVAKGDVIGYVGCTGSCTGPHVHYEVWQGQQYHHVNPAILYPGGY